MVSHLCGGERIMRSDVRALLRPLMKTVGAAFNRRVRRCRVPAGAGKLRCGQGNDAGILDLPWKIEWGYY